MKNSVLIALALGVAVASVARAELWSPLLAQVRWQDLSPETQKKARKNFNAYQKLTPEEKGRFEANSERWRHKSDEDKKRLRHLFEERSKKKR